jgi:hypothetical protein
MAERRTARVPQKVVHRHRVGSLVFERVSELVFVRGEPKAVLHWIDIAGVRTPIYLQLDPARLRRIRPGPRSTFYYDGTTADPGLEAVPAPQPAIRARRRTPGRPLRGGRRRTDPPLRNSDPAA